MRELVIDGKIINDDSDCYVIAEIGNNHGGSLDTCLEMIKEAKNCGADAVKLQKRHNQTLYIGELFNKTYNSENAYGSTYGAHREFLELSIDDYKVIQKFCKEIGITFFSTAFDIRSADQLSSIDVPAYKLASGDLKSIPLLKHVAKFGKPMIISTGGATMEDVRRAYDAIMPINKQLAILQCTAGYPPKFEELNLRVIETYRKEFKDVVIGFSSHDSGIAMGLCSYMLGGRILEKHFTLNRAWKGTDNAFSLEPVGLRKLVRDLKRARVALGDGIKVTYACETDPVKKMAKSLVAARDLNEGQVVTAQDVAMKSPAEGIAPSEFDNIVGKKLTRKMKADDYFSFDFLSK